MKEARKKISSESLASIKAKLKEIISVDLDANIPSESIQDDISLYEDGVGLDSISVVNFVVAIERNFNIDFNETDINPTTFSSINNLSEYLLEKAIEKE